MDGWLGRWQRAMGHLGMSALPMRHKSGCRACVHLLCSQHCRTAVTFSHLSKKKEQNKTQLPATERTEKILFSVSSWLPGLCAVARVLC